MSAFYYNKDLFKKAGVNADAIKTWDDFLGAVKALKAAGITPIINGGGDKWPMHFYYSYLIMRIGGENALADAKAGKNGGFKNSTFVEAGKRLRELAALEPFQPGYLATKYGEAAGMFGDGKGAMELMFELLPAMQGPSSTSGKGLPEDDIGIFAFPTVPGGKGKATDTLGGVHGFLVTKSAPPEAVDFLKFFSQEKYAKEAAASGGYIPIYKGTATCDNGSALPADRRHPVPDHLPPKLPRPGSRAICWPGYQRCLGIGRGGENNAGSRSGGHPGGSRPAIVGKTAAPKDLTLGGYLTWARER